MTARTRAGWGSRGYDAPCLAHDPRHERTFPSAGSGRYCLGGCSQLPRRGRLRDGEDLGVPRTAPTWLPRHQRRQGTCVPRRPRDRRSDRHRPARAPHLGRGASTGPGGRPREPVTFFCGGSRNFSKFIDCSTIFVLDVDLDTLHRRLDQRPRDEWGSKQSERDLIVRLHRTKEDIPGPAS